MYFVIYVTDLFLEMVMFWNGVNGKSLVPLLHLLLKVMKWARAIQKWSSHNSKGMYVHVYVHVCYIYVTLTCAQVKPWSLDKVSSQLTYLDPSYEVSGWSNKLIFFPKWLRMLQ